MSKKKELMTSILLLAFMLGLILERPLAREYSETSVGVNVGDWIKYGNFLATWTSNDPQTENPPLDLIEYNNTEWITNTMKIINGAILTFQTVTHYKNGSETTRFSDVDIDSGDGDGIFMFISSNLGPGDRVYGAPEYAGTWINDTIPLVYMNALRETNYLKASQIVPYDVDQRFGYSIEYFWDKKSGILSERTGTFVNTTGVYKTITMRSEIMTETNIWEEAPDTTPPTAEAGSDQTVTVDEIVSFDAGGSSDGEGGWGIAGYEWDFGDGTQGTGPPTVTHAYNATGKYTVTLTVKDWAGYSDTDTLIVTVEEPSPPPPPPPSLTGVIVLVILIIVGLIFWKLISKK